MNKKFAFLSILLLTLILLLSFTVSAEEINEELYKGKSFRNPFVELEEPQSEAEEPSEASGNNQSSGEDEENGNTQNGSNTEREQRPAEPVFTFEDVKNEIPFDLDGIISSTNQRVALIKTGGGEVEFIRGYYEQNGYELIEINNNSVVVQNRGYKLRLMIGGEINEI